MNTLDEHINYNTDPYTVLKLLTLILMDVPSLFKKNTIYKSDSSNKYLEIIEKIIFNKIKCDIYYTNDNLDKKKKNNSIILTNDHKYYLDAEYGTICYIKTSKLNFSVYYNKMNNSYDIELNRNVKSVPLSKIKALFKIKSKNSSLKGGAARVIQPHHLSSEYYKQKYREFIPLQLMYLYENDEYMSENRTHRHIIGETSEFYTLHAFFNYLEHFRDLWHLLDNIESHLLYIINTYKNLSASTLFESINHMVTYIECEYNENNAQRIIVPIEPKPGILDLLMRTISEVFR